MSALLLVIGLDLLLFSRYLTLIGHLSFADLCFLLAFIVMMPYEMGRFLFRAWHNPTAFPAIALCGLVVAIAVVHRDGEGIFQGLSLAYAWLFLVPLFVSTAGVFKTMWSTLLGIALLNAVFTLIAVAGPDMLAWDYGAGRFGTIFLLPGELAKHAAAISMMALLGVVEGRTVVQKAMWLLIWVGLLMSVLLDGSRVQIVVMTGSLFFAAYASQFVLRSRPIWGSLWQRTRRVGRYALVLGFGIAAFAIFGFFFKLSERARSHLFDPSSGIETIDVVRYAQYQAAFREIADNPWIGPGFGETVTGQAIHSGYLQIFADVGLLGFVFILWFAAAWLFGLHRAVLRLAGSGMSSSEVRIAFSALFAVLATFLHLIVHPIGVARTDWIYLLASAPLLYPEAFLRSRGHAVRTS